MAETNTLYRPSLLLNQPKGEERWTENRDEGQSTKIYGGEKDASIAAPLKDDGRVI